MEKIPPGSVVHNVELKRGKGGQIARSAGTFAQVVAKDGDYVHIKMPSNDVHLIHEECLATIGSVSNPDHSLIQIGMGFSILCCPMAIFYWHIVRPNCITWCAKRPCRSAFIG